MSGEKKFSRQIEHYIFKDKWIKFKSNMHGKFDDRAAEILNRLNAFDNHQRQLHNTRTSIAEQ